jgi:D-aminopeptidase
LAVAGDRCMLDELGEGEMGSAALVATKEGKGRAHARSRDVDSARAELSAAIATALAEPLRPPPARSYPAELRITAEGEELVRTTVAQPNDLLTAIATVFRTSSVSREYRQLAKLLPAGHDSRLRKAQRRLGSLLATPVMLSKERRWLASSPSGESAGELEKTR